MVKGTRYNRINNKLDILIASTIINSGAISIRDVDNGDEPFVYSTGNRGPGYLMIKGLVGQPSILKSLTKWLAHKVVKEAKFDFIEGNATGGMIPGWQLRNDISDLLGKEVPFCYLRGSRKEGGHGELITGNQNNPLIKPGMKALIVEELVNYAGTTANAAEEFRAAGHPVSHAACILSYDHTQSNSKLKEKKITLVPLITLPRLLDIAKYHKWLPLKSIQSYRDFLKDPLEWQLNRNLVIPESSAMKAQEKGYQMKYIDPKDAIKMGAPAGKVKEGVRYWALKNGK